MEEINYQDDNQFFSGHVACAGCVEALSLRVILNTVGPDAVAVVPPSCTAVICGGFSLLFVKNPGFFNTP